MGRLVTVAGRHHQKLTRARLGSQSCSSSSLIGVRCHCAGLEGFNERSRIVRQDDAQEVLRAELES
jgi:hypothetical protein